MRQSRYEPNKSMVRPKGTVMSKDFQDGDFEEADGNSPGDGEQSSVVEDIVEEQVVELQS